MKSTITCVVLSLLLVFAFIQQPSQGQGAGQAGQKPPTTTVAPDIPGVVKGGTVVEVFERDRTQSTEGPNRLPDGSLIFSERPSNRITKIDKDNKFSVFIENSTGAQGMAWDSKGNLVATMVLPEDTAMNVSVIYPKGQERILADRFGANHLTRPNDLVITKSDGIYFTDPGREKMPPHKSGMPNPWLPASLYYMPPGWKELKRVSLGEIDSMNGLILSPDERTLYVNDTSTDPGEGGYIVAFDVLPDGRLANRRNFAQYQANQNGQRDRGDGMAMDSEGRVYACTQGGWQVFSPQGAFLGRIPTFGNVQNAAFAGPDRKTLYGVGGGIVYKVQMLSSGHARGR